MNFEKVKLKKKESILIVDNSVDKTGAFKAIFEFAKNNKDSYIFLFVLTSKSILVPFVKHSGFAVEKIPFLEVSKKFRSLILYIPMLILNAIRLKRNIVQNKIDLVHINDFYNLTAIVAKMLGARFKLLTHVRFMPDRFPKLLVKLWIGLNLKYADKIICVSNAVKKQLPPHPKICAIYDTIINEDPGNQINNHTSHDVNFIQLLYPAHYIRGKGQNFALEAFHLAYKNNPLLRLKFVGGDMGLKKNQNFKIELIEEAKRLQLADFVEFAEPTDKIKEEMRNADIVLNFSESESFSFICLEALFCGRAVISTDCGGPSEIIDHGKTGWIVPNKNIDAMKAAILKLAGDEGLRLRIAENGYVSVRSKFSEANTHYHLKQLYNIVLNE